MKSFLPTLRHPFQRLRLSLIKRFFGSGESESTSEIRQKMLSSLRKKSLIPLREVSHIKIHIAACLLN